MKDHVISDQCTPKTHELYTDHYTDFLILKLKYILNCIKFKFIGDRYYRSPMVQLVVLRSHRQDTKRFQGKDGERDSGGDLRDCYDNCIRHL